MTIKLIALFKLYKIVFASSEDKMFAITRVFHNRSRKGIPQQIQLKIFNSSFKSISG